MSFVGPFPASSVVDRLKALGVFKLVGTAGDLQTALEGQPAVLPAAFVIVEERSDAPKGYTGGQLVQNTRPLIQLVLFSRNYAAGAAPGAAASKDMELLVQAARSALVNWSPSPEYTRLHHIAGRSERFKGGLMLWQEMFRCSYRIQQDAP